MWVPMKSCKVLVRLLMNYPHYVDSYEMMQRVGKVAYELKLLSELALAHSASIFYD